MLNPVAPKPINNVTPIAKNTPTEQPIAQPTPEPPAIETKPDPIEPIIEQTVVDDAPSEAQPANDFNYSSLNAKLDSADNINEVIKFSQNRYRMFLNLLKLLNKINACKGGDIIIVDGKIRQYSYSTKHIFDIDISALVGNATFTFTNVSPKIELLDLFTSSRESVIYITDKYIYIGDDITHLVYRNIISNSSSATAAKICNDAYLDNKSFNDLIGICITDENLKFEFKVNEKINKRISKIAEKFQSEMKSFKLTHEDSKLVMTMESQSLEQRAKVCNIPIDNDCSFLDDRELSARSDVLSVLNEYINQVKCYKFITHAQDNKFWMQYTGTINDCDTDGSEITIPLVVYTRASAEKPQYKY